MNSSCVLCYKKLECVRGQNISTTRCGHLYHQDCIIDYVKDHSQCAYCKEFCTVKQLVKLQWQEVDDKVKKKIAFKTSSTQLLASIEVLKYEVKERDEEMNMLRHHMRTQCDQLTNIELQGKNLAHINKQLKNRWESSENERENIAKDLLINNLQRQVGKFQNAYNPDLDYNTINRLKSMNLETSKRVHNR
ncbi:unnamed protein product [Diamesa serratosioi]